MTEILEEKLRKARKRHTCSYCGEVIEKGETYEWAKLVCYGHFFEWENHVKCGMIASALWEYAEPYDGMTSDLFNEICQDFCHELICPDCCFFNLECDKGRRYCTDRIFEKLQTHDFVCERDGLYNKWKLIPKKLAEQGDKTAQISNNHNS